MSETAKQIYQPIGQNDTGNRMAHTFSLVMGQHMSDLMAQHRRKTISISANRQDASIHEYFSTVGYIHQPNHPKSVMYEFQR